MEHHRKSRDGADELERAGSSVSRKMSLVKPERRRLGKDDPGYYYTLATEEGNVTTLPSTTGNDPRLIASNSRMPVGDDRAPIVEEEEGRDELQRQGSLVSRKLSALHRADSRRSHRSQRSHPARQNSSASRVSRSASAAPEDAAEAADEDNEAEEEVDEDLADEDMLASDELEDEELETRRAPITSKESSFNPWRTYCLLLTAPFFPALLRLFGLKTADRQMAWREKIGLISVILLCGLFVGYLTFGFTETVCSNTAVRIHAGDLLSDELLISGSVYELGTYEHPAVTGIVDNSPILYPPVNAGGKDASFMFQNVNGNCKGLITPKSNCSIPYNSAGEVGWYFPCQLLNINNFTLTNNSELVTNGTTLYTGWGCHTYSSARTALYNRKASATIYYTWDDLWYNNSQQLVTYNGDVLNLDYLDFLLTDDLDYPELFDKLRNDLNIRGRDLSQEMSYGENRRVINCLREITKVGEIDTDTIGCIASKVVLYISLVFIMGLVIIKFLFACYFRFFIARRQGAFPISENEFKQRERQIEDWGDDIYTSAQHFQDFEHFPEADLEYENVASEAGTSTPASPNVSTMIGLQREFPPPPISDAPSLRSQFAQPPASDASMRSQRRTMSLATATTANASSAGSVFGDNKRHSVILDKLKARGTEQRISNVTMGTQNRVASSSKVVSGQSLQKHPVVRHSVYDRTAYSQFGGSSATLDAPDLGDLGGGEAYSMVDLPPPSFHSRSDSGTPSSPDMSLRSVAPSGPLGGAADYLVPQPPVDYQPFGYPLIHVMCMVTAYSESIEGLRTTLDSICTTEYPNSHQLIAIVCDGLVKGSGNDLTTPEICLSMMTDFAIPVEDVQAYSYVSVVSGSKRHNMAKVYAGFYKYDEDTVPLEKQQRVPIICIVKCGTPQEANSAKPGNRGKRDSQIILMSFLQRVMFDERMTELEFEIFQGIRSVTGIAPDFYELLLMVDADTKVFPDCLTHMCAEMVKDPEIMGLCGETKIANKRDTWVTMIQVFEYFISHHQAKAFESVFGGVTCLPGCFSIYRIKSPKGQEGYWVPILCNPDIVERYSDNAINTLHSKNLLLLGEDRYLSTLMLRTFPKRKMVFLPKAACKTVVPDQFKVLLSQRRRWINSTIHNLFELLLVRDLCGVFIISMQFVVFVDLVSTLVLPAAITFTLYVVIIAIVKKPTPVLSLVLLAMILGLPGVLIVVTATRASYLVWMLIYLAALPVWNFILPMYAYWHFDDFSWGETRAVVGGNKAHDETEGEFDSSQIIMKRWREFQADRERMAFAY